MAVTSACYIHASSFCNLLSFVLNTVDSLWISEALLCGVVTSEGCGAGAEGGVAADVSGVALLPEHH